MRVDLAAQVNEYSNYSSTLHIRSNFKPTGTELYNYTVANAFAFSQPCSETEKFVCNVDRFFNCFNVRSFEHQKSDLKSWLRQLAKGKQFANQMYYTTVFISKLYSGARKTFGVPQGMATECGQKRGIHRSSKTSYVS